MSTPRNGVAPVVPDVCTPHKAESYISGTSDTHGGVELDALHATPSPRTFRGDTKLYIGPEPAVQVCQYAIRDAWPEDAAIRAKTGHVVVWGPSAVLCGEDDLF